MPSRVYPYHQTPKRTIVASGCCLRTPDGCCVVNETFAKGPRKALRLGHLQGSELPLIHGVIVRLLSPSLLHLLNKTCHPITKPSSFDTNHFFLLCRYIRPAVHPLTTAITQTRLLLFRTSSIITSKSCLLQPSTKVFGMTRQVGLPTQSIDMPIADDECLKQCDSSS